MKSIAFFNNKGGVGKTTLLCNLAAYVSKHSGKRVLVIDADPQSNATSYLLPDDEIEEILEDRNAINLDRYYDTIADGIGFPTDPPARVASARFGVDLVPGNPRFALREDLLSGDWNDALIGSGRGLSTTFAFRHLLHQVSADYDLVFVDMGPSLGAINRSILLSVDYFLTPMSVDLFSLMAIDNILTSLKKWRDDLALALEQYRKKQGGRDYSVDGRSICWNARFLGYVMQQYRAKSVAGKRQAVKSFETLLQRFGPELAELEGEFGVGDAESADLGRIPSLASLVPLSQLAHAPIFDLATSDGVVGAHFAAVDDASELYGEISKRFFQRLALAGDEL
ncbi:ParA family protein [Paracidovorax wautersii]|uniref:ParA family protein n=1 Tax=Paracidovorax wautersii TaxID=1177982 RepID=UPI0031E01E49